MKKGLLLGFLVCYLLGGLARYNASSQLSYVTPRGAAFFAATWLPLGLLPVHAAMALTPDWAWRPAR